MRCRYSALLYHTETPPNSKFWPSKSSQSLPRVICGEDTFSEVPDFIGAPEGIRTPDPQIRSLVLYPTELPAPWTIRVTLPNRFSQPPPSTTIFSLGFNLADVETISHNLNCVCATCPQNRRLLVMARAGENNTGSR